MQTIEMTNVLFKGRCSTAQVSPAAPARPSTALRQHPLACLPPPSEALPPSPS
jgi:hypothetical protein